MRPSRRVVKRATVQHKMSRAGHCAASHYSLKLRAGLESLQFDATPN
jgi:hypothetical protein